MKKEIMKKKEKIKRKKKIIYMNDIFFTYYLNTFFYNR